MTVINEAREAVGSEMGIEEEKGPVTGQPRLFATFLCLFPSLLPCHLFPISPSTPNQQTTYDSPHTPWRLCPE